MAITISGLFIYPIKSCRGIPVFSAELTALGFKYDRNYMLIEKKEAKPDDKDGLKEDKWIPMTIREHPKMLLINTVIEGDNIIASADGFPEQVTIPLSPSPNFLSTLQTTPTIDLFGTDIRPRILPDHSSFFANFLNVSTCKLVYLGPDPRPTIINQAPPSAQGGRLVTTTFADCAPYLLLSQESFDDLQEHLPADGKLEGVTRFRPNIVVKGVDQAYDEDGWKEIEVGSVGKIYCVARMPRCQLPNVNPATGVKDPNQPYKTMTKYRRIDPGAKYHPCLGMCAVTDKIEGQIKLGDLVTVVSRGEHSFIGF